MRNIVLLFTILIFSCKPNKPVNEQNWMYVDGTEKTISDFEKYTATVITFLSPECPLSENYTKTLNDLEMAFKGNHVRFLHVFSGTYYSRDTIQQFIKTYQVKQEFVIDEKYHLAKQLNATITPESFVVNASGDVVYSGAIDNWAVDLGQKRQVITEFYVRDVLRALIHQQTIPYAKTQAIGCFLEIH